MYASPACRAIAPAIRRHTSRRVPGSASPVVDPRVAPGPASDLRKHRPSSYSTVAQNSRRYVVASERASERRCSRVSLASGTQPPGEEYSRRVFYVKTMVYLYQLYAYARSSTFADFSSDFPPRILFRSRSHRLSPHLPLRQSRKVHRYVPTYICRA